MRRIGGSLIAETELKSPCRKYCKCHAGPARGWLAPLEYFWRPQIFAPVFYLICYGFTRYNKKNYIYILFIWELDSFIIKSAIYFLAPPSAGALMQRITCIMGSAGPGATNKIFQERKTPP